MSIFEPVNEENAVQTLPYFAAAPGRICDDTAGVTYQWRKLFSTYICMTDGCLMTRSDFPTVGICYSVPVGTGDAQHIYEAAREDARSLRIPLRFACVTEERLPELK